MNEQARKKPKANGNGKGGASDYRFANVRLDSTDAEWLESNDLPTTFPLSLVFTLVESGYKVSFSYDAQNNSALCTLTDTRENSVHLHTILSGRGATPIDAWYSLAYKHFVRLGEDWNGADSGGVTQRWR